MFEVHFLLCSHFANLSNYFPQRSIHQSPCRCRPGCTAEQVIQPLIRHQPLSYTHTTLLLRSKSVKPPQTTCCCCCQVCQNALLCVSRNNKQRAQPVYSELTWNLYTPHTKKIGFLYLLMVVICVVFLGHSCLCDLSPGVCSVFKR